MTIQSLQWNIAGKRIKGTLAWSRNGKIRSECWHPKFFFSRIAEPISTKYDPSSYMSKLSWVKGIHDFSNKRHFKTASPARTIGPISYTFGT